MRCFENKAVVSKRYDIAGHSLHATHRIEFRVPCLHPEDVPWDKVKVKVLRRCTPRRPCCVVERFGETETVRDVENSRNETGVKLGKEREYLLDDQRFSQPVLARITHITNNPREL